MDKVSISRIVHYVLANGEHRPAIIVRVWPGEYGNDEVKDGINIQVFLDGGNDRAATQPVGESVMGCVTPDECKAGYAWRTSVRYGAPTPDGTGMLPGFWHWPERSE